MSAPHRRARSLPAAPVVALATAGLAAVLAAEVASPTADQNSTLLTGHVMRSLSWERTPQAQPEPVDDPELRASRSSFRPALVAPPAPPAAPAPAAPAPSPPAAEPKAAPKPQPAPPAPRPSTPPSAPTPKPSSPPKPAAAPRPASPPVAPAPRPAPPAPPPSSVSSAPGTAAEAGLTPSARKVANAVRAAYSSVTIGGLRAGGGDHSTGKAVDIMVPSGAVGDAVAALVQSRASELGVAYVIWRQRIWSGGAWRAMEDRGSATANHMDHVHVSVR